MDKNNHIYLKRKTYFNMGNSFFVSIFFHILIVILIFKLLKTKQDTIIVPSMNIVDVGSFQSDIINKADTIDKNLDIKNQNVIKPLESKKIIEEIKKNDVHIQKDDLKIKDDLKKQITQKKSIEVFNKKSESTDSKEINEQAKNKVIDPKNDDDDLFAPQLSHISTINKNKLISSSELKFDGDFPFNYYIRILKTKINDNWNKPFISGTNAKVIIYFQILKTGQLKNIKVYKSSGYENFDNEALRAINSSSPFPVLPVDYKDDNLGVYFSFEYI